MKQSLLFATALVAMATFPIVADDSNSDQNDLTLSVFGGIAYSDNVAISAIDASSGVSDMAATLDLKAAFKTDLTPGLKLDLSYDFSKVEYLDEGAFSMDTHSLAGGLVFETGGLDVGLDGGWIRSSLDGNKFLTQSRLSPSVAKMFGDATYVRASWTYTDINFANLAERDGENHLVGVDSYIFLTDEGYVNFGAFLEKENTESPDFDYDGYVLNAGAQVPFLDTNFYASVDYGHRSYDNDVRTDNRWTFKAGITTDLFAIMTVKPEYTFRDISSTDELYSYSEHMVSLKFGVEF